MHRTLRFLQPLAAFVSALAVWLVAATRVFAQEPPTVKSADGGMTEYMLSYLVVILAIVLGLLVVAKASNRRERERPAGYVEKNLMAED